MLTAWSSSSPPVGAAAQRRRPRQRATCVVIVRCDCVRDRGPHACGLRACENWPCRPRALAHGDRSSYTRVRAGGRHTRPLARQRRGRDRRRPAPARSATAVPRTTRRDGTSTPRRRPPTGSASGNHAGRCGPARGAVPRVADSHPRCRRWREPRSRGPSFPSSSASTGPRYAGVRPTARRQCGQRTHPVSRSTLDR